MTLFCQQVLRSASRWLLSGLALAAVCQELQAETIPDSAKYNQYCMGCHGSPLSMAGQGVPNSYKILTWSALNVTDTTKIVAAMRDPTRLSLNDVMRDSYFTSIRDRSDEDLLSIYNYLRAVRDTVVSGGAPKFATSFGSSVDASVSVTIDNYRGTPLNQALSVVPTVPNEFTLFSQSASPGCIVGTVPAARTASPPTTCTISATVRFQPGAVGTRTGILRLALTAPNSLVPDPPARDIALSAEAVAPLTPPGDGGILTFTTAPNVPVTGSVFVSNSGGTSLKITGLTFSAQAIAANYGPAPTNGCPIGQLLAANGSSPCTLVVIFSPTTTIDSTPGATLSIEYNGFGSPKIITLAGVATIGPHILFSPPTLPTVDVQVGASAMQTILLHNDGVATLQFSDFKLDDAEFERGGTCSTGTELSVGVPSDSSTNCTIELTFRPTAKGPRTATLVIVSNASNNKGQPVAIVFSANGVDVPAPKVMFTPSEPLDFKSQTVGGIYPARSVKLTNAGNAALSIASLVVEGAAFTNASANPCPAILAIGASCTIDIRFTPAAAEIDYTGALRVSSNATGSPHGVALAGHGTAAMVPVLEWLPPASSQLDFGLVSAGTLSATRSVTFVNRGPGGVNLSVVNAVGTDAAAFSVTTSNCAVNAPLFQDIPCSINITFSPGSAGTKSATLQIASSGSAPAMLTLTGTGLGNLAAGLALSTTAMTFDATRLGAQSVPVELTLSGTGAGAMNITGVQISGPYVLQNKTCATAPFLLAAGSSCTLAVTFQPQAEGSAAGMLRVTTDATPAVQEIALNGTGQAKANVSSGGCSMASGDTLSDPTLGALVVLAIAALVYRRRARAAHRQHP